MRISRLDAGAYAGKRDSVFRFSIAQFEEWANVGVILSALHTFQGGIGDVDLDSQFDKPVANCRENLAGALWRGAAKPLGFGSSTYRLRNRLPVCKLLAPRSQADGATTRFSLPGPAGYLARKRKIKDKS